MEAKTPTLLPGETTISTRLTWMNMLVSGAALILACGGFAAYDLLSVRDAMVRNLSMQANIIGSNSVTALVFNDAVAAENTLSALQAAPNIVSAAVYTPEGAFLAGYWRDKSPEKSPPPPIPGDEAEVYVFAGTRLQLARRIVFQDSPTGSVYIQSDLQPIYTRLKRYGAIVASVLVTSMMAALLISRVTQRRIAKPIASLATTARKISQGQEYSIRAKTAGTDYELRVLIEAFNDMLEQIQKRDQDLQEAREGLELRVQQRTAELTVANQELEAFSYSVSHDLRAPLRTIDGFSHALLEDCSDALDEKGKNYLQRVRAATQRMGVLIDDLLNLARVTRAEMRREPVNLSTLARDVAAELQRAQPNGHVNLSIGDNLLTTGDARLLRVILENLLGNAWKFTANREAPRVEFDRTRREGVLTFFIRDNGAGFDQKYAGRLFNAFQRLHAASEFPGTGVGLATVQRIVHRHGGRVWAEGEVGSGATFYFTLPEAASDEVKSA